MDHQTKRKQTDDPEGNQIRFDPYVAAAVLRKLSELVACESPRSLLDPSELFFVSVVGVFSDVKVWFDGYRTSFDYFVGDLLLIASRDRLLLISVETFVSIFVSAALELVMIARLAELRDVRTPHQEQGPAGLIEESQ